MAFEFDAASDALRRSTHLGPTVLRNSHTVGPGIFSLQVTASYFELADSFRPINYLITQEQPPGEQGLAKLGLKASAHVTLINLSATYGVSQRIDVGVRSRVSGPRLMW